MDSNELDIVSQVRKRQQEAEGAPPPTAEEELVPREMFFSLRYLEPGTGKELTGSFFSVVPVDDWQTKMARYSASLAGGVPWESLPPEAAGRFAHLAMMAICTKEMPEWATVWAHSDVKLLLAITGAVGGHHARFLRADAREGKTKAGRRIVEVKPSVPSATRP